MVYCATASEIEKKVAILGNAGVNNTAFTEANEISKSKVKNGSFVSICIDTQHPFIVIIEYSFNRRRSNLSSCLAATMSTRRHHRLLRAAEQVDVN